VAQLRGILVAEVGDDDHQRAPPQLPKHLLRRLHVVRMVQRRLDRKEFRHQAVQRALAFLRRERSRFVRRRAECHGANRVAALQRHIAEQHHRVHDLIEMRGADRGVGVVRAHAPSAVDQHHHALVTLVLELADDRPGLPERGAPVDVPHRIADAVLGQLLEVGAFAALLIGLDADFLQAPVAGQPRILRHLREVGEHAPGLDGAKPFEHFTQPESRFQSHVGGSKLHLAARGGNNAVPCFGGGVGRQPQRQWQSFREQTRGGVVVKLTLP
jgi:hypothetical protein